MNKYLIIVLLSCLFGGSVYAQSDKLGFGFRAGASYSNITGPSEMGPDGASLESMTNKSGFHIGASFDYKVTDLFGFRGEIVFSQRGSILDYNGPSYYHLGRYTVVRTTITGDRQQSLKVNNTYFDIPITVYHKIGIFELSGGFYSGILLSSNGGGATNFDGKSSIGTDVDPFSVRLEHNYKTNKAQEASPNKFDVDVDGFPYAVPSSVGAYYDFESRSKNLYKTFDFGLVAGASIYINSGLYIRATYMHGLTDVDRNEYDISLQTLSPESTLVDPVFVQRADENKSRAWQFSVGFSF